MGDRTGLKALFGTTEPFDDNLFDFIGGETLISEV